MLVNQQEAAGRSSTEGRKPDTAWVAAPGEDFPTDAHAVCPLSRELGTAISVHLSAARSPGMFLSQPCCCPQGQVSSLCPIQLAGSLPEALVPREG